LIILTKNYIYKCKLNEAKPNTIELKNKIKKYQSFDQYIAKKNNTVQAYEKFWAPIYINNDFHFLQIKFQKNYKKK
jgi:hypothetical protein